MKSLYLEISNKNNLLKKILKKVSRNKDKIIIHTDLKKASFKTKMTILNKIMKILSDEKTKKLVLSNEIKKDQEFVNLLHSNNIYICSQKWLFKRSLSKIIDEIFEKNNLKKQEKELYLCVNEVDIMTENYIYKFAKEFKRVNIITNHIGKFKTIEKKLYEDDGILITVTNNKRKSIAKAEYIINFDFPKELINQFTIYDNATIISLEENIKIKKKRFVGKIIDDLKIDLNENETLKNYILENKLENYDIKDICEALEII